ncbi:MAG: glycosyltransferase family 2 protein [Proteobacteria bacterium]|nr:glycosyltransferase family 2 protein [Pseudomonadota bacterium]MBU1713758.1 glycosyltransferase family 2 protein [Pseudomonadota bacterium]
MEMVLLILKSYLIFTVCVLLIYTIRHFLFTMNRLFYEQRVYYHDLIDSDIKSITILIPMHNEEQVAEQILDLLVPRNYDTEYVEKNTKNILDLLVGADYPHEKMEIIPINDFSSDKTQLILDEYARKYNFIKPLHRYEGKRGKPAALNEGLKKAQNEIIIVFDADYLPPKGILKDIAVSFNDPEVGAVMGRVVPVNTRTNFLTRLLDLERTGGYQVDQQARFNLKLIPQYGGTVGGFRKDVVIANGSFDTSILAEDTELTFRLLLDGWKVIYANRAECYEEAPETWSVRARQIRRWSRGHNQVLLKYLIPLLASLHLTKKEKIDGVLLLFVYTVPLILVLAILDSLALFFLGEMQIVAGVTAFIFIGAYNTFGNFAPFYQIGVAALLDGATKRVQLLPMLIFNYFFNTIYITIGFFEAFLDRLTGRSTKWIKTKRFRNKNGGAPLHTKNFRGSSNRIRKN